MKSEFGAPKELTSILQRKNRKINMRQKDLNFLDRNEFNYSPSKEVVEALKNFDINKLCFYTRIYDEGKKSILSVFLSELYDIDETQVLLGYGGEDILKQAVHYFLTEEDGNKTMLIPKFSWWYYKSIADEVNGRTLQYPLYEDGNTFKYDFAAMKDMIQKENPKILLLASPNNPTGNGLTPEELDELLAEVPAKTKVLIDEAYASFVSTDTRYIKELVNKYPNLIISRTLSKFYGLPGLRMGFGFMSKELEKFSKYSNKYLGGVYIDVFPLDGVPTGRMAQRMHFAKYEFYKRVLYLIHRDPYKHGKGPSSWIPLLCRKFFTLTEVQKSIREVMTKYDFDKSDLICDYDDGMKGIMPKKILGVPTPVLFENEEVWGVQEYDTYLSQKYGDYMTIPKQSGQRQHNFHYLDLNKPYRDFEV